MITEEMATLGSDQTVAFLCEVLLCLHADGTGDDTTDVRSQGHRGRATAGDVGGMAGGGVIARN